MRNLQIAGYLSAFLGVIVIATLFWIVLTDEEFAPVRSLDANVWQETQNGYISIMQAERTQHICVCAEYRCPHDFESAVTHVEPTHLYYEGWLRPHYSIIKDPEAGNDANWGRQVHASGTCLHKAKGQAYTLYLNKSEKDDWLKLSIE